MESSRKQLSRQELEGNEHYQLILTIRNYIFQSTWKWIGFLGGVHEVCLAKGDWVSSLPNYVNKQWKYIESYLKDPVIHPSSALLHIRSIGETAAKDLSSNRDPFTAGYYMAYTQAKAFNSLDNLKREFSMDNKFSHRNMI